MSRRGPGRALLDALEELSGAANPEIVRAAALRLLRVTSHDADHATALRDILAAAGDPRDIDVFVGRTLELGSRPTIDELAERFGVCAERIRQIRTPRRDQGAGGRRGRPAADPGHGRSPPQLAGCCCSDVRR